MTASLVVVRWTRSGHPWAPLAGAPLSVRVDGTEAGTVITDGDGLASNQHTAARRWATTS